MKNRFRASHSVKTKEVRKIEQPREPRFYPNRPELSFNVVNEKEDTLQSIDETLKRIEKILLKHISESQREVIHDDNQEQ